MWLLLVAILLLGLCMPGRYLYISYHDLIPVVENPVARRLPCFAYRWYVMRFYLRNWCESANLEIVPHIGPYTKHLAKARVLTRLGVFSKKHLIKA